MSDVPDGSPPSSPPDRKPASKPASRARNWIGAALRMAMFPAVLLWPAGTWRWWEAWAMVGAYLLYAAVITVYLQRRDPTLLAERLKGSPKQEGQKAWDVGLMLLMFVTGMGIFVVPGFDVVRWGWSERLPLWVEISAMAIHLPCFWALGWIMRENTYLSRVVKIDEERGHHVITTGPYAIVRHPMYVVASVMVLAMPLALGSRWGLIPAVGMVAVLVVRTALEDRTLHQELEGYREYAAQTRYRLLPGVW